MSARSRLRLVVLHVLVISLMAVLVGRLWYIQVLTGDHYAQAAQQTRTRDVLLPALRGEIYDSQGRPFVDNNSKLVVAVSRSELSRLPDDGKAVLRRLAKVLPHESYQHLSKSLRLCSTGVDQPCWSGSPYQPVPVATNVDSKTALQIMERKASFPGVSARPTAVRNYPSPSGAKAAHLLGHLAPISSAELKRRKDDEPRLTGNSRVGGSGLEEVYEQALRGTPGTKQLQVNSRGMVTGTDRKTPPVPGSNLVTSIDADVQDVVERALRHGVQHARGEGAPANAAAAVVLDVRTGRVVAMGGFPTFDPSIWVGGISQKKYEHLQSEEAGQPLLFRATQGQYPVGSTFKVFSTAAAVKAGFPLHGAYQCPSAVQVGGRTFHNYGGYSYGSMHFHRALVISCDTVYYRIGYQLWQRQQGKHDSTEPIPHMAKRFGLGHKTGIDLPSESSGRIPDPEWKREYWEQTKDTYCKRAKNGYPDLAKKNPSKAHYLTGLAKNQCKRGYVWRPGDAVNLAIGQGDMLATPLQLARAYAALANGGTVYSPRIGKAVVRPDGSVVKRIQPPKVRQLKVPDKVLSYIRDALADVPRQGTAAGAFGGFPLNKIPVAGKTGTAQAKGEEDTAWFASFAPANHPRYAVVAMVSQGGLGAAAAAPIVRDIYEGIYGVGGKKAALPDGPPKSLPDVAGAGGAKSSPKSSAESSSKAIPDKGGATEKAGATAAAHTPAVPAVRPPGVAASGVAEERHTVPSHVAARAYVPGGPP